MSINLLQLFLIKIHPCGWFIAIVHSFCGYIISHFVIFHNLFIHSSVHRYLCYFQFVILDILEAFLGAYV